MSKPSPPSSPRRQASPVLEVGGLTAFPRELHMDILTFLRATDLSALQRTCTCFNQRDLVNAVVEYAADEVYGSDLTKGFDSPIVGGEVKSVAVVSKKGGKKSVSEDDSELKLSATGVETAVPSEATRPVYTYEMLRNMEMLVVARVLSRPEPPIHERSTCFYVSKSWCKAALRWLEVQEEERREKFERQRAAEEAKAAAAAAVVSPKGKKNARHTGSSGKKKVSRKELKEQRARERRNSDAMPPWSNINDDIMCEHGDLKHCSGKSARARRRTMDKKAWKVLKKLYPDSVQIEAGVGVSGCLMCAAESEAAKKAEADKKEEAKAERKKPLVCPLVRGFYSRGNKGYPVASIDPLHDVNIKDEDDFISTMLREGTHCQCPLEPGVYWTLPRSWCKNWRKYLKTGEGALPPPPDGSEMLCDAHNLPLVPPHLEAFLSGEFSTLYGSPVLNASTIEVESVARMPTAPLHSSAVSDAETLQALRAAGLSEVEVHSQRVAMMQLEEERQRAHAARFERQISSNEQDRAATNEQLDRENKVVVEILTDEEVGALEKWWPHVNIMYGIRFAVIETDSARREILWHTPPCRECDPSSRADTKFHMRSRLAQRGFH
ncbi:hypothetical protein ACHAXN_005267 [Cyclotella atomus]